MKKTEIKQIIEKQNIKIIRLMFTDMLGTLKNVEVPIRKLDDIFENKILFDGSSIEGFVRIEESDMLLVPDLNSFRISEWEAINCDYKVGIFFCDVHTPDGKPFLGDPRSNLKKTVKKMNSMGFISFNIGLEPEFFLFKRDENGTPTMKVNDNGGYFDLAPSDYSSDCRRDILFELEKMGFEVEASHHETAPGQHEINFKYSDVIDGCDKVQLFKLVTKNIARRHNLHATFMPKPIEGLAGSGMHTNCSLTNSDGNNAFYDPDGKLELSNIAYNFIGGLLIHAKEICAITNQLINSYKRLVPGYEAPCYISYSDKNRSTLIRIPSSRKQATRCELRMVDAATNPYLAMSVILASGLDGIKKQINPGNPIREDIFEMSSIERKSKGIENLPGDLNEAINIMKDSTFIKEVLGEHIFEKFIEAKKQEWDSYRKQVTGWEIERYFRRT